VDIYRIFLPGIYPLLFYISEKQPMIGTDDQHILSLNPHILYLFDPL